MQQQDRKIKFRLRYAKLGAMRYLSHLDMMRLMTRAIRRAGVPVTFSRGFNPRPRISILAPLPVGIEAENELMEMRLDEPLSPDSIRDSLNDELVDGIEITDVEPADRPMKPDFRADYEVELPDGLNVERADLEAVMARGQVCVELKTAKGVKTVDLRPFLISLELFDGKLRFAARVTPQGTARPDAVVKAVFGDGETRRNDFRIRRTSLRMSSSE